ncbi:hypothetical protein E4U21_003868 [Claviceps maximensis]|nr:hypothetical protein E4U21_003868 [Claviceps maximensis]
MPRRQQAGEGEREVQVAGRVLEEGSVGRGLCWLLCEQRTPPPRRRRAPSRGSARVKWRAPPREMLLPEGRESVKREEAPTGKECIKDARCGGWKL